MDVSHADDILKWSCLVVEVATLQTNQSVRQRVLLTLMVDVLLYYLHKV